MHYTYYVEIFVNYTAKLQYYHLSKEKRLQPPIIQDRISKANMVESRVFIKGLFLMCVEPFIINRY